ncbi:LPXTG cell wall anchor domain-containing protein [Mammaliicoccus vitulinus]|uniref:LPXTG cell wall anchor domain-containing protein n=2 Tax=Mammaliicoccus vitulinus TaxID=71237 RepID=A0ABX7HFC3_9STAP|nr:hypothetical protein CD107_11940 [Mammaliicoccus vitulinus]QRO84942.1 LPXTG cell wall anchor domain-containing protein [Mammaliicoccus vitulinus]
MELNKDSLQLSVKQKNEAQPRFYSVEEFENAGLGNVTVNGNNINVRFNTPSYNELMVYYSTKITDNSLKSFENQSSASYIDKNEKQVTENSNAIVQNINSGGKAEGDLAKYSGKVVINKVGNDENGNSKPLEGAEFELVNLDGEVVGKGTTDSSGSLVFDNIKGGTHTLKETKIPNGYKIDETNFPKQVVLDFENDKGINLNVVNIKEAKPEEPTTEEPKVESNKGESNTGKSTEEKMNKDHENKNIIESKDQVRNNQSGKVENSTGTPEKSQQKDNEKSKDSGDKGGILPNTGEAIQNHPIVTTASILLLLTFGIALVFFRRKQQ